MSQGEVAGGEETSPWADWTVERCEDLDEEGHRHKNAFYTLLKHYFDSRDYTAILLMKAKYDKICQFCIDLIDGSDAQTKKLEGNLQAYEWERKYDVVVSGEIAVLVLRPDTAVDVSSVDLSSLWQPTYAEKFFADLLKIHSVDHCKGTTFFKQGKDRHGNVARYICKMFTDCCLHCIALLSRKKPVARINNIISFVFGVRGQVDVIDFQSMPDGDFQFLLNYIDHGIKKLTSIPLVAKQAASIALALLMIFTKQGPNRKPPRKVSYKHTFGVPDRGQTLDM
jgi:hypothetical protein